MHLTPVDVAVRVFGSAGKLSLAAGLSRLAAVRWREPRRGAGGLVQRGDIPLIYVRRLVEVARERQLPLTLEDLVYGRDVPDTAPAPLAAPAFIP